MSVPPLTASVPAPLRLLALLIVRVPALNCSVTPALTLYSPLSVPSLLMMRLPACTFNVPVLLIVRVLAPIACVPAALLLKVPALTNACPELLNTAIGAATVEATLNTPPAALVSVEGAFQNRSSALAPRFTVPLFVQLLPTPLPVSAIVVVPLVVSVPVPSRSAPLFQMNAPFRTMLPLPPRPTEFPPVSVKVLANVSGTLMFSVPPDTVVVPVPAIA